MRGEKILAWGGLWKPERKHLFSEFARRQDELAPVIQRFLGQLHVLLAPLDCAKRPLERIEAAVSRTIQAAGGVAGAFQDDDIDYTPRRKEEDPFTVKAESSIRVIDLPEEIIA